MERSFIATNESEFIKDYEEYKSKGINQRDFVKKFLAEKGIESNQFYVRGDGMMNQPFREYNKSNITLSIEPTAKGIESYKSMLKKPSSFHGLSGFKKNSSVAKEFAQRCVDEEIVINLHRPRVGDYFKSIGYLYGCAWEMFKHNDKYYLKVDCEKIQADDTPNGFIEIKLSDYHLAREEFDKTK